MAAPALAPTTICVVAWRTIDAATIQGAAPSADLDPDSPECDIAARYLVDQKFIAPADAGSKYVITVAGFDRVREMRGIGGV